VQQTECEGVLGVGVSPIGGHSEIPRRFVLPGRQQDLPVVELAVPVPLAGDQSEVFGARRFILFDAAAVEKGEAVVALPGSICLVGQQLEVPRGLGLVPRGAKAAKEALPIMELRTRMALMGGESEVVGGLEGSV
jgi:hypothetical protein